MQMVGVRCRITEETISVTPWLNSPGVTSRCWQFSVHKIAVNKKNFKVLNQTYELIKKLGNFSKKIKLNLGKHTSFEIPLNSYNPKPT